MSVVSGIVTVDVLGCGMLENEDRFNSYIGYGEVRVRGGVCSYLPASIQSVVLI